MSRFSILSLLLALLFISNNYAQRQVISGGHNYSVALGEDGKVYGWGLNDALQMGLKEVKPGVYEQRSLDFTTNIPQVLAGLPDNIVSIDAGTSSHVMALTDEGKIIAWGSNSKGQLGNCNYPVDSNYAFPIYVLDEHGDTLKGVKGTAGASVTSYAITLDGRVLSWGANIHDAGSSEDVGMLGWGTSTLEYSCTPNYVVDRFNNPINNIVQVSAGDGNGYALRADGQVYSWGNDNSYANGRDGSLTKADFVEDPTGKPITNIKSIAAGDRHCLALHEDGTLFAWGGDWGPGQIGEGPVYHFNNYAVKVNGGESGELYLGESDPVVKLAAGQASSAAITKNGKLYLWGGTSVPQGTSASGILANNCIIAETDSYHENYGNTSTPLIAKDENGNPSNEFFIDISEGDLWYFAKTKEGKHLGFGYNSNSEVGVVEFLYDGSICYPMEIILSDKIKQPCPEITSLSDYTNLCQSDSIIIETPLLPKGFSSTWYHNDKIIKTVSVNDTSYQPNFIYLSTLDESNLGTIKISLKDERKINNTCPLITIERPLTIDNYSATIWKNLKHCASTPECNENGILLPPINSGMLKLTDTYGTTIDTINSNETNCINLESINKSNSLDEPYREWKIDVEETVTFKDSILKLSEEDFNLNKSWTSLVGGNFIEFNIYDDIFLKSIAIEYRSPSNTLYHLKIINDQYETVWEFFFNNAIMDDNFHQLKIPVNALIPVGNNYRLLTEGQSGTFAIYQGTSDQFPKTYYEDDNQIIEVWYSSFNQQQTNKFPGIWNWEIESPKSSSADCPINTFIITEDCDNCTPPTFITMAGSELEKCVGDSALINLQVEGKAMNGFNAVITSSAGDTLVDLFPLLDNDTIFKIKISSEELYHEVYTLSISDGGISNGICHLDTNFVFKKPTTPTVSFGTSTYILCENESFAGPQITTTGDISEFQWLKNGEPYLSLNEDWSTQTINIEDQGHYQYTFKDNCTATTSTSQEVSLLVLPEENPNCTSTYVLDEDIFNVGNYYSDYVTTHSQVPYGSDPGMVEVVTTYENHTGHSCCPGNFLLNRTGADADKFIWTDTVDVESGKFYLFSAWFNNMSQSAELPEVAMFVEGVEVGRITLSGEGFEWEYFERSWQANTTGEVAIGIKNLKEIPVNLKTNANEGQVIGLDDISFVALKQNAVTATLPELSNAEGITAYPNPFTGVVHFSGPIDIPQHVVINDITGKVVLEKELTKPLIDLSSLHAGLYFIEINDQVLKVIKE